MQAAATFNRAVFTARPLHRPQGPSSTCMLGSFSSSRRVRAGAEDALEGTRGAPLTRPRCLPLSRKQNSGGVTKHTPVFPRQQSWDPYKLLGVDHYSSEEEVRSARNFLLKQYAGYEESEEAIEGAYDKIIMNSYSHRKKSKINLKSKLKKQAEESPSWLKALLGYIEVPSLEIISRRFAFLRSFLGQLLPRLGLPFGCNKFWRHAIDSLLLQLALSLVSCIYFFNEKMKNLVRASTVHHRQSSKLEIPAVITKKIALADISTANPNLLISGPTFTFLVRESMMIYAQLYLVPGRMG
ncbi:unnamed protein product [Miscanthus lutarioriparius]|uniref:Uncharacterized protein n=1 Tax=Miscanthus lutarioriparius TaxID=422564 RepID=A0A811R5U5_9POAL|nr:unnamed protein product [Miscanthus lutarioriparius]